MPDLTFTDDDFKGTNSDLSFSDADFGPPQSRPITALPSGLKAPVAAQMQQAENLRRGDPGMQAGTEMSSAIVSDAARDLSGFIKGLPGKAATVVMAPFLSFSDSDFESPKIPKDYPSIRPETLMERIRGSAPVTSLLGEPGIARDPNSNLPTGAVPALFSSSKPPMTRIEKPETLAEGLHNVAANVLDGVASPGGFVMAPFTAAGKLAYYTAADVISKIAGDPQYGGNLKSIWEGKDRTPAEEFMASTSKDQPYLTALAKTAAKAPGIVAGWEAFGGLPGWGQKLLGAGFTADMLSNAPEIARGIGEEMGKNPGQRDMDRLTSLIAEGIETGAFAGLGLFHGLHEPAERILDKPTYVAKQVAKQLDQADFTPGPSFRNTLTLPTGHMMMPGTPNVLPSPPPSAYEKLGPQLMEVQKRASQQPVPVIGQSGPVPEAEAKSPPAEYKHGLIQNAHDLVDQIHSPAIMKAGDTKPKLAQLREIAAKLGVDFEEPVGPFDRGNVEEATNKMMRQIHKKYGDIKPEEGTKRYASGQQKAAEVYGDLQPQPGGGKGQVSAEKGGPGVQPQAEPGVSPEGQTGREVPLTGQQIADHIGARFDGEKMGYKTFTLMDKSGKESTSITLKPGATLRDAVSKYEAKLAEYGDASDAPRPVKSQPVTADEILSKPSGSLTHDQIMAMPDSEVNKMFEAMDDRGARKLTAHGDGVTAGVKLGPDSVPELDRLRQQEVKKGLEATKKVMAGDNSANETQKAAYGRALWLEGAIEGANKKGPNFEALKSKLRYSAENPTQREITEMVEGNYGSEKAHPSVDEAQRAGGTVADTLKAIGKTSKKWGRLAQMLHDISDKDSLNVKMVRDDTVGRSHYDTATDQINMAGSGEHIPVLEHLHEIFHAITDKKIPQWLSTFEGARNRGEKYLAALDGALNDPEVAEPVKNLIKIYKRAMELHPDERVKLFAGDADAMNQLGMNYGLGNLSEFIAESGSRGSFQEMLEKMPGLFGKKNLWQNFVDAIRNVLGLPARANSLLADALQEMAELAKSQRPQTMESDLKSIRGSANPLKTFADEDLKPFLEKGKDVAKAVPSLLAKVFSPETLTRPGDVDILFKSKGDQEKFLTQSAAAMSATGEMFNKMSQPDLIKFWDLAKQGQKQATPALDQAAELLRKWDDQVYDSMAKHKPGLPYLDNHLRVLWKVIPGSEQAKANMAKQGLTPEQIASKRPWRGSMGMTRRHTLNTFSEGLARGGVPVTYNPIEMFALSSQDAMKFVAANQAWEGLKATGATQFVKRGQAPPPGYSKINDSIAKAYFRTPDGLITSNGEWWANDGVARMINNYLSRDYIRQGSQAHPEIGTIGRGLLTVKNATTAIELGMSPFHAVFETNEAVGSSMGLAFRKILAGRGFEGAKEFARAALLEPAGLTSVFGAKAPRFTTAGLGEAGIKFAKNVKDFQKNDPETYGWFMKNYPQASQLIDDLFTGGGQVKMNEEYRVKGIAGFKRALSEENPYSKYTRAVVHAIPAVNEVFMKPLFEMYIPRLKVGMFLKEYSFELDQRQKDLMSGKISRGQLARQTWASIEDRFGELNWDNLYWNRTFKTAMQLAFRSVTWKLGNIRAFGKAARDTGAELGVNWWKEGRAPRMTQAMGWAMGMSIVTAMQASFISKVTTGKYPWELAKEGGELIRNLVFPRIDPVDPSQRVSIPTYWKDLVHATHDPVDYVKSSMTGEAGRLWDIWNNRDFYGTEVYNPDDPLYKRSLDKAKHLIPLPFGMSSQIAAHRTGATGARALAGYAGFPKAPYYMSYTPAELKLSEIIRNKQTIGPKTKDTFQRGVNERIAVEAIKRGEMTMDQAVEKGLVRPGREKSITERVEFSHLEYAMRSPEVTPQEAVKVYELANKDEREKILPIITKKITNSKIIDDDVRDALFERLDKADASK